MGTRGVLETWARHCINTVWIWTEHRAHTDLGLALEVQALEHFQSFFVEVHLHVVAVATLSTGLAGQRGGYVAVLASRDH